MELATFQWIAGIVITAMGFMIVWIIRDFSEKIRDLREEIKELRASLDEKAGKLHVRIDEQVKTINAQSVTLAAYQGTFMTREEHSRHCQQQRHQP